MEKLREARKEGVKALGQYELIRLLGKGAVGQVYLARHAILEREFAVKVLHPEWVGNAQLTQRFFQEARLASRLVHENIVQLITADRQGDVYYLVMEYIDGVSLETMMEEAGAAAGEAGRGVHPRGAEGAALRP